MMQRTAMQRSSLGSNIKQHVSSVHHNRTPVLVGRLSPAAAAPGGGGLLSAAHTTTGSSSSSVYCGRTLLTRAAAATSTAPAAAGGKRKVEHYIREMSPWPTDVPIVAHDPSKQPHVDLVIAGAGPSGLAVGERVARAGYSVCIIDPAPLGIWPNNYGVWVDEFEAMGLGDCLEVIWPKAKVFLDSDNLGAKFLDRPYGRVDRPKLKRTLLERCVAQGVTFITGKVDRAEHGDGQSTVFIEGVGAAGGDGSSSSGSSVQLSGSLVLDATGHSRRLVEFDKKFDPGYQGAYGIVAEVESHPFDTDTMLFMDWRDDHLADLPEVRERNSKLPTFLYAMPFTKNKVFLEETSLVARPAVPFPDLKERLEARMKWLGIKVKHIEEEEYCLIPMGGVLPKHPQRVLGIGGTAGMVHPSTGFMVSRMLGVAPTIADAIIEQLSRPTDKAVAAGGSSRPSSEAEANAMAAGVWRSAWPVERLRQRAFFCFGMDVLLKLNLEETRSFFNAFFSLSDFNWHGFLSARLGFLQLIGFGLSLFANSSNQSRLDLLQKGLPGLVAMLLELAPTLGDYYGTSKDKKQQVLAEYSSVPAKVPAVAAAAAVAGAGGGNGAQQQQASEQHCCSSSKVLVGAGSSSSSNDGGNGSS